MLLPYLITTWSPEVAFITSDYEDQRLRVTTHVENNFPQVQAQWKQNVSLSESRPTNSILPLIIEDSRFFQLPSWTRIVEGLGYRNSFWNYIGDGWSNTIVGLVIGLMGIYLGIEDDSFKIFIRDTGKLLLWVGLGIGTLVISLLLPNIFNYQLDAMLAQGNYHQVVAVSQNLASWYPPLKEDINFLERMAKAEFYGDELESYLHLFQQGLERYRQRDFLRAKEYFRSSLSLQPKCLLVKEYLVTSLLNQGVVYFNNNQPGAAANLFQEILDLFPGNIEALYNLMLTRAFNNEHEEAANAAEQIIEIQKYFQLPDVALLGQAHIHLTWASYHKDNLEQAWKEYRKSVDKSTWK